MSKLILFFLQRSTAFYSVLQTGQLSCTNEPCQTLAPNRQCESIIKLAVTNFYFLGLFSFLI